MLESMLGQDGRDAEKRARVKPRIISVPPRSHWRIVRAVTFLYIAGVAEIWAGSLDWEKTTIEVAAKPVDKTVTVNFAFRNTTDHPVEIVKIRTSCGCTVAESAKKTFAPGEKGTVKAVFTTVGRKGKQEKAIVVETSEKGTPDVLTLRVNLPDTIKVNKEMLSWNISDPLESQAFDVSVIAPGSAKVVAASPLGADFQADLKVIKGGEKYQVIVTPVMTDRPVQGTIRLEVADPAPRAIFLQVQVAE